MIASRFLGLPAVGLQAVARSELGVELSKGFQKDDWSRRPLTPAQEEYALADVRHLIPLQERLARRLREKGRLEWVLEECEVVAGLDPARRRTDPNAYQSIKGARRLSRRGLAVLRGLHAWREAQAAATDRPAFKIVPNEALLAIAEGTPRSRDELARVRGASLRLRAQAAEVLDIVARALATPEAELPSIATAPRPVVGETVRRRTLALRAWRALEAARLELDASIVLPQRLLERVAELAPRDEEGLARVEGLRRWRAAHFGEALLAAVASA
jgi:ribonuclease D